MSMVPAEVRSDVRYRGRFAPSPTGDLHLGSLVAAVASYLDARAHGGQWLLRMEDVDETRAVPGAADRILRTLEAFGFEWDEEVLIQSRRRSRYREVIDQLLHQDQAYPCRCTRAQIAKHGQPGIEGFRYPGLCREGVPPGTRARSIRIRTDDRPIAFHDRVHGAQIQNLDESIGDFVIRRADGFTAYQLAVVVDDAEQAITHVVRGADLLLSTPRQVHLLALLGQRAPSYAHVPMVVDVRGSKLSKSDRSRPIIPDNAAGLLRSALCALGQISPDTPTPESLKAFWPWAIDRWDINRTGTENVLADTL